MAGLCGNCENFHPETQALNESQIKTVKRISPGDQPFYGKCRAGHTGKDGKSYFHDFGTMTAWPCSAEDDQGNKLFSPLVD